MKETGGAHKSEPTYHLFPPVGTEGPITLSHVKLAARRTINRVQTVKNLMDSLPEDPGAYSRQQEYKNIISTIIEAIGRLELIAPDLHRELIESIDDITALSPKRKLKILRTTIDTELYYFLQRNGLALDELARQRKIIDPAAPFNRRHNAFKAAYESNGYKKNWIDGRLLLRLVFEGKFHILERVRIV